MSNKVRERKGRSNDDTEADDENKVVYPVSADSPPHFLSCGWSGELICIQVECTAPSINVRINF